MATVDDASELLLDRGHRASFTTHPRYQGVDADKVTAALIDKGAADVSEARFLMFEAIERLGGKVEQQVQSGGLQSGGRGKDRVVEQWLVPRSAPGG